MGKIRDIAAKKIQEIGMPQLLESSRNFEKTMKGIYDSIESIQGVTNTNTSKIAESYDKTQKDIAEIREQLRVIATVLQNKEGL